MSSSPLRLFIGGTRNTDLVVERVRLSFVTPWRAVLYFPDAHDAGAGVSLWDTVEIQDQYAIKRFYGWVTDINPGGVSEEGLEIVAQDRRFRLEQEPVRINGRSYYIWNRRGYECEEGLGGLDSPDLDGGKWTCGQIIIDILEHALGLPDGDSDISGHHSDQTSIVSPYLTADDIASYTAADWLDNLTSIPGEFSVDDTPVADAITLLLAQNGGFWGWYIDSDGALQLIDLESTRRSKLYAGESGHWEDEAGQDYNLLSNRLTRSLGGVFSTIAIQGRDRVVEEMPSNIEGGGNAARSTGGELERVAAPWGDYAAAYRPRSQIARKPTAKDIDEDNDYTPPDGSISSTHHPRVYQGTEDGAKYVYSPSSGEKPKWFLAEGIIAFNEDPATTLPAGEKLWGWYWAEHPFRVVVGPRGGAYDDYGYERMRTFYDPTFRHVDTYPQSGTTDDEAAMRILADRLLKLYENERRQGELVADQADFMRYKLGRRFSVENLAEAWWGSLDINAVEIEYDFTEDSTAITVANTFFLLPGYEETKRRLEQNLFTKRELSLSENIYDCQVKPPSVQDPTTTAPYTTTPPPTTAPPGPTTTPAPPVAEDDSYSTDYETLLEVAAPGVLSNDTYGGTAHLWITDFPDNGYGRINRDGSFRYTPYEGFCGDDTWRYKIFDGHHWSNEAVVTITVENCPTTTQPPTTTVPPTTASPTTPPPTTAEPTTTPPPTTAEPTTTPPPPTTTGEPTTTTCPSSCSGCELEYSLTIPCIDDSGCDAVFEGADYTIAQYGDGPDCEWYFDSTGGYIGDPYGSAENSDDSCGSPDFTFDERVIQLVCQEVDGVDQWLLVLADQYALTDVLYVKPASACPDGTYTRHSVDSGCAEITDYPETLEVI